MQYTFLDAFESLVELKTVVCMQPVANDCPGAIDVQLRKLSRCKDLLRARQMML